MNPSQPTLIERAFQIARSGDCESLAQLRDQLRRERYPDNAILTYVAGKSLRKQLMDLMLEHRRPPTRPD